MTRLESLWSMLHELDLIIQSGDMAAAMLGDANPDWVEAELNELRDIRSRLEQVVRNFQERRKQ